MNKGVVSVLVAYLIWGLYPFYFHACRPYRNCDSSCLMDLCAFGCLLILLKALAVDPESYY